MMFSKSVGRGMGTGGIRWGAGRPAWHVKAEHCKSLDIRRWKRDGYLREGTSGTWRWTDSEGRDLGSIGYGIEAHAAVLTYSVAGSPVVERIAFDRTLCTYGGSRAWFKCPRCRSRVAKLFMRGLKFACRSCHRIVYASQSEDACARTWRRQAKLEARLGEDWARPKGMHRATHERLLNRLDHCEGVRDAGLAAIIGRLMGRSGHAGR